MSLRTYAHGHQVDLFKIQGLCTHGEVGAIQSLGQHPRIAEIFPRDLLVPVKAKVEEIEHLCDDRRRRFGEVSTVNPSLAITRI